MQRKQVFEGSHIKTHVDLLRWQAEQQPDKLAYIFLSDGEKEGATLTYAQLDRQARAVAVHLQRFCKPGDRALLIYPQSLDYIVAFFACLYADVIAVPSYPPRFNQNMARVLAIIKDAAPSVVLTTANLEGKLAKLTGFNAVPEWTTDLLDEQAAESWHEPAITAETLAFLQYTSGSTGTPKGVMVSHDNLLANHSMLQQVYQHDVAKPLVSWLPLFHDMGLIGMALQAVYLGSLCVLMAPSSFLQRPARWLKAISHYRAHTSYGPDFAFDLCTQKVTTEQKATLDLSCWKIAVNGSEPVRYATLDRFSSAFATCGFRHEAFYPAYGLAEATLFVTGGLKTAPPVIRYVDGTELAKRKVVPVSAHSVGAHGITGCGRSAPEQQVIIVDPETLLRCPADQVGEIWIASASVAQGYWQKTEETAHTFQAYLADTGEGPFLRTGDLGLLLDSELFIVSRLKDLIIIDGRNHYPADIEQTIELAHPAIRSGRCIAFSAEVENKERLIVAVEVDRRYQPTSPDNNDGEGQMPQILVADEVIKAIRRSVAQQHDVTVYAVNLLKVGKLPRTSSGKLQRQACRAAFLEGSLELWDA